MKHSRPHLFLVAIIIILINSCAGTPVSPTPASTVIKEIPAEPVVLASSAVWVDDSTVLAPLPAGKIISFGPTIPNGIATDTSDGIGITFYGPDGIGLGELHTASLASASPATVHIGGSYTGALDFPLVFYASENSTSSLRISRNGQTSPLVEVPNLSGLIGIPGQPLLAYASMEPLHNGVLRTRIFLGDLASLPNAAPILIVERIDSRAAVPVRVRVQDGVASGLWYTLRPWGIGGEVVFDPLEGLFFLDLKEQVVYRVLPEEATFSDISQSQTRLAYSLQQNGKPVLSVLNLVTNQSTNQPLLTGSDRGAGAAIFGPSDQLAWMEVRGRLADGTFFATIRVVNSEGIGLQDYPQSQFYKAAGLGDQVSIKPVGWLDEQSFLVQVCGLRKGEAAAVVRVDTGTGALTRLAPGTFVGFMHHP
jgi:hypothetical protein